MQITMLSKLSHLMQHYEAALCQSFNVLFLKFKCCQRDGIAKQGFQKAVCLSTFLWYDKIPDITNLLRGKVVLADIFRCFNAWLANALRIAVRQHIMIRAYMYAQQPWHMHVDQRTASQSRFFPSFVWPRLLGNQQALLFAELSHHLYTQLILND